MPSALAFNDRRRHPGASPPISPEAPSPIRSDIIRGLGHEQATISSKYFYNLLGSELFERITRLPEYYLTRTEAAIMAAHGDEITRCLGIGRTVIELGAGNCEKARRLCDLIRPARFVAVDIAAEYLHMAAAGFRAACPDLEVRPVVADLTKDLAMPEDLPRPGRVVFYPGSSIGNFDPPQAGAILSRVRDLLDDDGALLIGVDLVKDADVLEAAYNDAAGVTAAFNLNILSHVNHLIASDFDLGQWRHRAFFNPAHSRIEMRLEAITGVTVRWPGGSRKFLAGESIHTEHSYKYRVEDFLAFLAGVGLHRIALWTDPRRWYAVVLTGP